MGMGFGFDAEEGVNKNTQILGVEFGVNTEKLSVRGDISGVTPEAWVCTPIFLASYQKLGCN